LAIFQNTGLKGKMMLGGSAPLILVVVLCMVTFFSISSLLNSTERVDHTHQVIEEAMLIEAAAVDMETGMRGYLLAGRDEFLDPYKQGQKRFEKLLGELQNTVSDNPAQVQLLSETKETINQWQDKITSANIRLRKEIGDAKTMDDMADLVGQARGKKYFDKFRDQIKVFVNRENVLMKKRQRSAAGTKDVLKLRQTNKWVDHTHEVIQEAMLIEAAAVDMETGMRGYLLAGKEEFLDPYNNGKENFQRLVASLSKTVNDNPAQVQLLGEINRTIREWQDKVTEPAIDLRRKIGKAKTMNDMAALVRQAKGKKYFDKFRNQIKTFRTNEETLMLARKENASKTARNSKAIIIIGMLLTIGIAMLISYLLAGALSKVFKEIFQKLKTLSTGELNAVQVQFRRIIEGLGTGATSVSSASNQTSTTSNQIAKGAGEQASSLEEISASLEEMSSITKQNAGSAGQANNMAGDARKAAEEGVSAMARMNDTIDEIKNSSDETAKIIKTIDEIAFQTNLLALNAAVEAARAGEAGKGFAVVAEEVRNLAMRSAEAAKSTANLIEGSQKNADNGVNASRDVEKILKQIVENINKVAQLIQEVSAASNEQSQGIDQVNSALSQMDKITQENAANAEESASASEELSTQAESLTNMVGSLVAIVGDSGGNGSSGLIEYSGKAQFEKPTLAKVISSDMPGTGIRRLLHHGPKKFQSSKKGLREDVEKPVKSASQRM